MSSALPGTPAADCCVTPCDEVVVQNIAGPKGDSAYRVAVQEGFAGTEAEWLASLTGEDGVSAFTLTAANFTMPAEGANVAVPTTTSTAFLSVGAMAYAQGAGHMRVMSLAANSATLRNEENSATGVYAENVAPGTVIGSGAKITSNGLQGIPGTGSGDLISTNNLSDVANAATARTQLGLAIGTNVQAYDAALTTYAGIPPSANVQSVLGAANFAAIRTLLALIPGTDIQAFDAFLLSIAALGTAADRMIYTTGLNTAAEAVLTAAGRAILDDLTAAAQRSTLGVLPGYGLLASQDALDLNAGATDTAITVNATRYLIDKITLENSSAAVTTATLGLFTAAGGGGTTLAANQALSGTLTATTKIMHLAKQAVVDTDSRTDGTLYLRVGTAEGAARTVNAKIYGWQLAA